MDGGTAEGRIVRYSLCRTYETGVATASYNGFGQTAFRVFDPATLGSNERVCYHATIRGAPWLLETIVITTASGTITSVIYWAVLKSPSVGEVSFKKSIGLLSDKLERAVILTRGRSLEVLVAELSKARVSPSISANRVCTNQI